jgi:ABC-2 type transport system permease protein
MNEMLRAAWVIARRDFTALIRSKAFIFFLVGPLLMFGIALAAGGVGNRIAQDTETPVIALVMNDADAGRLTETRDRLDHAVGGMPVVERASSSTPPDQLLRAGRNGQGYAAILTGSLDRPVLHASAEAVRHWAPPVRLLIATAHQRGDFSTLSLDTRTISAAAATAGPDRRLTAQIGQMALFLLTMLLAGMVLSNLVEEKTNKIIEILAASVPMDAIFLGKLFAMLAMAFTGIAVWSSFGAAAALAIGTALPSLPPPAVGWPLFLLLGARYVSTAYLLLAQLVIFFFASYALPHLGEPVEIAACLFPFSSPFAMLARAGQQASLWPHLAALLWQGLWTMLIIRAAATLFRRNVLKSGRQGWRRRKPFAAQSPKR